MVDCKFFLGMLLVCLFAITVSAEINLIVTANVSEKVSSIFLQTNEKASPDFDPYDLEYPPFPGKRNVLFSSLNNKELIMDSWNSQDRKMKIIFTRDSDELQNLDLAFKGDISSTYKVVLNDYGSDSTYTQKVGTNRISGNTVYSVNSSEEERYFLLDIDYLYCGDGLCSADENCDVCAIDCLCGDEFLKHSIKSPYYFLTSQEILDGTNQGFSVDEGYSFNFKNESHTVLLHSIIEGEARLFIVPGENEIVLVSNELLEIDVDNDGLYDIALAANEIMPEGFNLFIQGINEGDFSDATIDVVKKDLKVSIFDESITIAGYDVPVVRIIVTTVVLILGIWLVFISAYWLKHLKDKKNLRTDALVAVSPIEHKENSE